MGEKKGNCLQQINIRTHGELEELLLNHDICPVCLESDKLSVFERRKGMLVCVKCGFSPPLILNMASNVPFNRSGIKVKEWIPGHGLGETIGEKGRFCVYAHSQAYEDNKEHLPMSAKFMRIITSKIEHPKIMSLLKFHKALIIAHGLDRSEDDDFKRHFAVMLRQVGSFLVSENTRCNLRQVAYACFALALRDLKGEEAYAKIVKNLQITPDAIKYVSWLLEVKKRQKQKRKVGVLTVNS